ncbi:MAG TPA: hypothetical protein VK900_20405 [Anaerolineales bacterium]|nr:hypothetical protein [Anaerolineales bacterium]
MSSHCVVRSGRSLFIAIVIAMLVLSMVPAQAARAEATTTSDLAVKLVSIPKHAKACQVFEAVYTVKNLGPDPATHLYLLVSIPDAYDVAGIMGLPETLAVGQIATVSVVIKVVAFEPGETRRAWVGVTLVSDYYLEPSFDPDPENSTTRSPMRLIGKPSIGCP